ncbi:hypothetical protein GAYE_SCF08G2994 [Galdieria yellowstonensis]|uniref:ACB domain-containing protein n=2 Tax=Galdieria yellowstonensis TaxID=3028027 RepID=A0AAV9ICK6_9RHOD|nr:hypothetical protein GAYE_SCF08G2994 [Galdieria yellowstonensis]
MFGMHQVMSNQVCEASVELKYLEAVENVQEIYKNIPESDLLELYGLYKRIKDGEAPLQNPFYFYQWKETAKWKSWKEASNKYSKEEAMKKYIALSEKYHKKDSNTSYTGKQPLGFELPNSEEEQSQKPVLDLCYFTAIGDISSVRYLLEKDSSVSVDQRDPCGLTPLMYAADRGYANLVALLIEHGASINAVDSEGQTALHYACICEYPDIISQLLKAGADKYLKDIRGQSPWNILQDKSILLG